MTELWFLHSESTQPPTWTLRVLRWSPGRPAGPWGGGTEEEAAWEGRAVGAAGPHSLLEAEEGPCWAGRGRSVA